MSTHEFVLPADFPDYAHEVESKGWFGAATLVYLNKRFPLTFYDPVRLQQTIEVELRTRPVFNEPNLLIVGSVTEAAMRKAADYAVDTGLVKTFVSE